MTIDVAFHGFVAADAESRLSKAGKNWVRLRVGVGKDAEVQWVGVAVFGKAAETAGTLKKGDRCYCEGTIKINAWRGQDGVDRHELAVAAFKCVQTHLIGRNRPKRESDDSRQRAAATSAPSSTDDDRQRRVRGTADSSLNDEIPI
jgi:single-stranded DNA-binding protein